MEAFERPHVAQLVRELTDESYPPLIAAVTGPRQSGKTTLVRQALGKVRDLGRHVRYVAIDEPDQGQPPDLATTTGTVALPQPRDRNWLIATWLQAREVADRRSEGFVLVLDEIQHVDDWSVTVKGLWDRDRRDERPLRVVILGSAPWQLFTGMGESLVGRYMTFPVRHWSLHEMVSAFDISLEEFVFYGGYPAATRCVPDIDRWRRYVTYSIIAPVFERDILALTRVDRPSLMRQLLDLAPQYSGQIVPYHRLVGRLRGGGNPTTLAHYLDLLSDAGIMTYLPRYSGSALSRSTSNPKLLVLNTALMTARSGYSFDEARTDRTFWGRIVETAVGAHLHNTLETSMHLAYWRDDPYEVDFVLFQGPHVLGIEVKTGRWRDGLPGLAAFKKRFPNAQTLLVGGGGGTRQNHVPLNEFLAEPARYWLSGEGLGT